MLLSVRNLTSYFFLDEGVLKAVDDVSFDIATNETVAIVGESGCGKTIVALSLINLVPPPGRVVGGHVVLDGEDVLAVSPQRLRQIRATQVGFVFQEPGASLNPVYTVGYQISEVLQLNRGLTRKEAEKHAVRLLGDTGIAEPERRVKSYPFELSGGMKQRAAIAIAISTRPKLLIADEPTTALDVTVQAEILDLLQSLQEQYRMAMLLITHDLGVVAEMAHRVLVMYAGKLVESAPVEALFTTPKHPYTKGLLASVRRKSDSAALFRGIPGVVPDLLRLPSGCTFHPRCELADSQCKLTFPAWIPYPAGRGCACYKAEAD